MAADRYGEMVSQLRSVLLAGLTPIEQFAGLPKSFLTTLDKDITGYDELKRQNEILKTEVLLLKSKQQQLINLKQEVARLEALLGTTGKIPNHSVQIAQVTLFSSNPFSQYISINKGTNDGIRSQQAVLDANGIVGQIVATTPFSSRVMLITDPEHQLPVRIQRTSQRGILSGTGYDYTQLQFIPKSSNVKVGDILESSGLGGLFPGGYPVATVTGVRTDESQPYLEITAQPVSRFNQAHKVLVLKPDTLPQPKVDTLLDYNLNTSLFKQKTPQLKTETTNQEPAQ